MTPTINDLNFWGAGFAKEMTQGTGYDPQGVPKIMARWQNSVDNAMQNWSNPDIKHYQIIFYNEDGSVYIDIPVWRYHPYFFYMYDNPAIAQSTNNSSDYSCIIPAQWGKNYKVQIIIHRTDDTKDESIIKDCSPQVDQMPVAPAPAPAPVKKKPAARH